jgi:hypothetical protein
MKKLELAVLISGLLCFLSLTYAGISHAIITSRIIKERTYKLEEIQCVYKKTEREESCLRYCNGCLCIDQTGQEHRAILKDFSEYKIEDFKKNE